MGIPDDGRRRVLGALLAGFMAAILALVALVGLDLTEANEQNSRPAPSAEGDYVPVGDLGTGELAPCPTPGEQAAAYPTPPPDGVVCDGRGHGIERPEITKHPPPVPDS
jgi:hypothetical protein